MRLSSDYRDHIPDIIAMFSETFAASEGPEAGQVIAQLVTDMLTTLEDTERQVFVAIEGNEVLGCILFSPLAYPQEERQVALLSPVAIAPRAQGQGLGQRLITHGLQELRDQGVEIAVTYGDINFYAKTGFRQISQAEAQPPLPLSYPHGWLGQSLTGGGFAPLVGPSTCVAPLNDPGHW